MDTLKVIPHNGLALHVLSSVSDYCVEKGWILDYKKDFENGVAIVYINVEGFEKVSAVEGFLSNCGSVDQVTSEIRKELFIAS